MRGKSDFYALKELIPTVCGRESMRNIHAGSIAYVEHVLRNSEKQNLTYAPQFLAASFGQAFQMRTFRSQGDVHMALVALASDRSA
jgi:hypothetical protein